MPVPGEVTLDEMKLLLERAHKGEIIPLYVFLWGVGDSRASQYRPRQFDKSSGFKGIYLEYSSRDGKPKSTTAHRPERKIFTNFWYAYAYCLKATGRPPTARHDNE